MSTCLVLDVTGSDAWRNFYRAQECKRIPADRLSTIMHPDRATAEAEALRLQKQFPNRQYMVFEAVTATISVKVPTHVSLTGTVLVEGLMASIVHLADVPF